MATEIERKFLLKNQDWKENATKTYYKQGYLNRQAERVVRVRIAGERAFLTLKGKGEISRLEFEYEIPIVDAQEILNEMAEKPLIEKYRYLVDYEGFTWEIDEFLGENKGLVVAEIELESEAQNFPIPAWLGEEVSHDNRYYNANLIKNPYSQWK